MTTFNYDRERLASVENEMKELTYKLPPLKLKMELNTNTVEEKLELETFEYRLRCLEEQWKGYASFIQGTTKTIESKSFSDADSEWIEEVTGIDASYRNWTEYTIDNDVQPGPEFKTAFERVGRAFHQTSEAGRRIYINLFLSEIILRPEFENALRIFPELELTVLKTEDGKRRKLNGRADYTIGFATGKDMMDFVVPRDIHMVAVEAKLCDVDKDLWQCIAQAATFHKYLVDDGKKDTRVWGILSTAEMWTFIYINERGQLSRSKKFVLDLRNYDEAPSGGLVGYEGEGNSTV